MRWVAIFDDNERTEAIRQQYSEAHVAYLDAHRDKIRLAGGLRPAPEDWYCGGLWVHSRSTPGTRPSP